ncbi:portal protein [Afipia felis]|uniref:Bacteriophage head to tail connecting protein n=3 Tax=Afipia felis TaxID=1035 RepID=A0A380W6L3_AFIFE|nr:portal protein [Afipia felis]SUU76162.1 Bacteriophage head to tail connecting protein [Afipia felis]SUU84229.1 Bacteriophage head to tail connecting protein [Afipia felis]
MITWREIEEPQGELEQERARDEPTWRDLARLLRPDGTVFNSNERRERDGADDPFDSTPLYSLDDFVGGTFTKAINPAERWFELGIQDKDLEQFKPVKQWLWSTADVCYASLHPGHDNFYLHAPAWFGDMGAFGTGFMWQEELVGQNGIIAKNLPIGESYKCVDAQGMTERYHRKFVLKGYQAKTRFKGRADVSGFNDSQTYTFILAVFPNDNYRPGSPFARSFRYTTVYVCEHLKDFGVQEFYQSFPVHEIEWSQRSGRAWATGPGHNALADMRGNDEIARSVIIGAQFDAEPMWWAQDEDVLTAADIQPNGVLYGDALRDKPPAQILERSKQMALPLQLQQDLRNQIRKAFHFGLSQVMANRPQMTAQEVLAYNADELKILAPHLVRIQRGLASFIARRFALLQRMGRLAPPPPELAQSGQSVTIEFVSPFAKAQQAAVAQGVMSWVKTKVDLQSATQDPEWTDDIDKDGVSAVLHDAMSGVPAVRLDPRDVAAKRQARAQAQQQQLETAQAAQQAEIIANVSHAQQASTLAKTRAA